MALIEVILVLQEHLPQLRRLRIVALRETVCTLQHTLLLRQLLKDRERIYPVENVNITRVEV